MRCGHGQSTPGSESGQPLHPMHQPRPPDATSLLGVLTWAPLPLSLSSPSLPFPQAVNPPLQVPGGPCWALGIRWTGTGLQGHSQGRGHSRNRTEGSEAAVPKALPGRQDQLACNLLKKGVSGQKDRLCLACG